MRGKVFVNPGSGPDGSIDHDDVVAALDRWDVEKIDDPERLQDQVRQAVEAGVPAIGVAGGDGTVRSVAEVLVDTGVPLLVIPAGTRNHFARELGNDGLEAVTAAAGARREMKVSVGMVNGHAFINNASIGLYADLVRRRERHQRRRSKPVANLVAALEIIRHGQPLAVEIEGEHPDAWLVFVGNGRYGDGFTDLIERDGLDSGVLDVRVIRADRRLSRLRTIAATAAGRMRMSKLVLAKETCDLSVGVAGRKVDVALDGEVITLEAPLEFEARPGALTVLTAP